MTMSSNHPADRLYALPSEIKQLEEQEALLRSHLIRHPEDRIGSVAEAIVSPQSRKVERLRQEVGDAVVDRHTIDRQVTLVRLKERKDGAMVMCQNTTSMI